MLGPPPEDRVGAGSIYDPDPEAPGKTNCPAGGYLDQVDQADWRALGIPPREIRRMDPQQRLLLEVAHEALEDAGLSRTRLAGSETAVCCGLIWDDYLRLLSRDRSGLDGYAVLGNVSSFAANRISYRFDLRGPSLTLNAACSSSLVAVHQSCQILRDGEADLALAGACELMLAAETDVMMAKLGVLSPSGRCRPLDADADGFVRGEGAAMVVLKPMSLVAPYDRVYALIAGSAVNHNGRNEWIMATSETALRDVVIRACAAGAVSPDQLAYVELHAAGGPKGDLAETRALAATFTPDRSLPCRIGSVKGNLGHLGAAAGMVSLIKVALSLYHREWLPTGQLERVHTDLKLADWGLVAQGKFEPWPQGSEPVHAGVTTTSLSGTNSHVVLRTTPPPPARSSARTCQVIPLSAHSPEALARRCQDLARWLAEGPRVSLEDLAFTSRNGRDHLAHRIAFVARDLAGLAELARLEPGASHPLRFRREGVASTPPELILLWDAGDETTAEMSRGLGALDPWLKTCLEDRRSGDGLNGRHHPGTGPAWFRYWLGLGLMPDGVVCTPDQRQRAEDALRSLAEPPPLRVAEAPVQLFSSELRDGPDQPRLALALQPRASFNRSSHDGSAGATCWGLFGRDLDELEAALARTLARVFARGFPLQWLPSRDHGRMVSLPIFPWQRQSFRPDWTTEAPGASPTSAADSVPPDRPSARPARDPIAAELLDFLGAQIQDMLQLPEPPSGRDSFFALGLNSMLVTALRQRIHQRFGLSLPAVAFFEYPTLAGLAASATNPPRAGPRPPADGTAVEALSEAESEHFLMLALSDVERRYLPERT
jgi:acyl transferase domain-containing protein